MDFLTKPVEVPALLEAIERAVARSVEQGAARQRRQKLRERYELGTAEQTVKVHRGRVMAKLEADSVPELIRIAAALGISPVGGGRDPKVP